jgi:2-haloacid dehalogenase
MVYHRRQPEDVMAFDRQAIKALTFDVGGTVFDWHSTIRDEMNAMAKQRGWNLDGAAFANAWRTRMFQLLGKVREGGLPWMNADQLHRMAIDEIAPEFPAFDLSAPERDELNNVWHRLRVWPDFPGALERLKTRYTVVVLTVLNWSLVVDSSKNGGLCWDGVLSCEFLGHYKPAPEAYQAGVRLLGLQPDQVLMMAAHPWDLQAASRAGLHTAYVPRPGERGAGNDGDLAPPEFVDVAAADFPDLAAKLAP